MHPSEQSDVSRRLVVPAPLRRPRFRRLWLGMSSSYAGDRLQQLAQAWLVATLTSSAMAVGLISTLGSLPLLLLPLGGVIADQVDRRRLLIGWQLVGSAATAAVALLVLVDRVAIWHIYAWAMVNGSIHLLSRPAYKVVLTKAVPAEETRSAVAINSMTETTSMVLVNAVGSLLLGLLGLTLAFILNTATYLVAALSLWSLRDLGGKPAGSRQGLELKRVVSDLLEGFRYLGRQRPILGPLVLTFLMILVIGPTIGLLAAIVQGEAGSIVDLGMLAAATSVGSFVGAAVAGMRESGEKATRLYALLGLLGAGAMAIFVLLPIGVLSMMPLALLGAVLFSQAVWNTSRVSDVADPRFQARLQAITSMAFTLGFSLGMLWAGAAVDLFGLQALLGGAAALALISAVVLVRTGRR